MIDFLGWDKDTAIEKLEHEGLSWLVTVTEPPKKKPEEGYYKVIKQEVKGDIYKLTVCMVADDFR